MFTISIDQLKSYTDDDLFRLSTLVQQELHHRYLGEKVSKAKKTALKKVKNSKKEDIKRKVASLSPPPENTTNEMGWEERVRAKLDKRVSGVAELFEEYNLMNVSALKELKENDPEVFFSFMTKLEIL